MDRNRLRHLFKIVAIVSAVLLVVSIAAIVIGNQELAQTTAERTPSGLGFLNNFVTNIASEGIRDSLKSGMISYNDVAPSILENIVLRLWVYAPTIRNVSAIFLVLCLIGLFLCKKKAPAEPSAHDSVTRDSAKSPYVHPRPDSSAAPHADDFHRDTGAGKCANCGKPLEKGSDFCVFCGVRRAAESHSVPKHDVSGAICPNGHKLSDASLGFCPICGATLIIKSTPSDGKKSAPPIHEGRKCPNGHACDDLDMKFCPVCGMPMDDVKDSGSESKPPEPPATLPGGMHYASEDDLLRK